MARLASTPVAIPFDPAKASSRQRVEYLHALWRADIDPFVFVGVAHRLGYSLRCYWDVRADMPVLTPLVLH
ncbi:hypothetical protein [Caballeronia sp. HLA56]